MGEKTTEELTGTVFFLESNRRSKSEGLFPYLYINMGERVKLLLKGDNPFENSGLKPYDGKSVVIIGTKKSNGTFVIEQISVKGSPLVTEENISNNQQ